MATILHSTQKSWKGPWLIDGDSIKELDSIIFEYWEELENRRKDLLEKDIKERYKSYKKIYKTNPLPDQIKENLKKHETESKFAVTEKKFYIILSKDHERSYPCESFSMAFRERTLLNETPCGFTVYLTSGDVTCKLFLDHDTNKFEVEVKPNDIAEAKELFTALYNWVDKHNVNPIQKFFREISRFQLYVLVPYFFTMLFAFIQVQDRKLDLVRARARQLLETGITQSNIAEAVETLLKIETQPSFSSIEFPKWFGVALGILIYLVIMLNFQPRVILGIGKGTRKIKLWKWWQGFVLATIPLFVLTLLLNFFGEKILQVMFP